MNKLDLRKIARFQAESARAKTILFKRDVPQRTSKEKKLFAAEVGQSGGGGALRKSSSVSKRPIYSIIIPAYQEAGLIDGTLRELCQYLHQLELWQTSEVIVVAADGGDNTAGLALASQELFAYFQVLKPGVKVGKGRDVKVGVSASRGDYVLFMDADLATPVRFIAPAFERLEKGEADVVIGVRNLWKIHKTLPRKVLSVLANLAIRVLVLRDIPDSQCGFKAFTQTAAKQLFPRLTVNGWGFDVELLAIAKLYHLRVSKLPITDWCDPKLGSGLVGEPVYHSSLTTLRELFVIRRRRKQGQYK